jgi:hypothetical protein
MVYSIGQFLKLDGSFYIVKGLTESGKPNRLVRANKYGIDLNGQLLTNNSSNGWDVNWELAEPMDPKYAKYEKVIAKMKQLDRKFQNRDLNKKDLTYESILDTLTRLARQQHEQS